MALIDFWENSSLILVNFQDIGCELVTGFLGILSYASIHQVGFILIAQQELVKKIYLICMYV